MLVFSESGRRLGETSSGGTDYGTAAPVFPPLASPSRGPVTRISRPHAPRGRRPDPRRQTFAGSTPPSSTSGSVSPTGDILECAPSTRCRCSAPRSTAHFEIVPADGSPVPLGLTGRSGLPRLKWRIVINMVIGPESWTGGTAWWSEDPKRDGNAIRATDLRWRFRSRRSRKFREFLEIRGEKLTQPRRVLVRHIFITTHKHFAVGCRRALSRPA